MSVGLCSNTTVDKNTLNRHLQSSLSSLLDFIRKCRGSRAGNDSHRIQSVGNSTGGRLHGNAVVFSFD